MTTATASLAAVVKEASAAEAAAAKAAQAAEEARKRAEETRLQVEAERTAANARFMDVLTAEYPEARAAATAAQGEAREAFARAVLGESDANAFAAYKTYVDAATAAWAVDDAIASQRYLLGRASRDPNPPTFDFGEELSKILNQYAAEVQQDAIDGYRARRERYLSGAES